MAQLPANDECHPPLQCLLFSLPTELRLQIYTDLLTIPPSINSTNDTCLNAVSIAWTSSSSTPTVLSILVTCRRLHHETADLFYSLNRMYITNRQIANISHLHSFFGTVSPHRLRGVKDVVLAVATFEDVIAGWKLVRDVMPKLEVLEFIIRVAFDLVEDAEKGKADLSREFAASTVQSRPVLKELRLTHKWASQLSPTDLWAWRRFGEETNQVLPFKVITCRP